MVLGQLTAAVSKPTHRDNMEFRGTAGGGFIQITMYSSGVLSSCTRLMSWGLGATRVKTKLKNRLRIHHSHVQECNALLSNETAPPETTCVWYRNGRSKPKIKIDSIRLACPLSSVDDTPHYTLQIQRCCRWRGLKLSRLAAVSLGCV